MTPENSTNPRNPLHIPSGELKGSVTSHIKEHQHTISENPQHSFTTHTEALQHPSSVKPGPAVAQVHATQHNSIEKPRRSDDTQTQRLLHASHEKYEEPAVVQLHKVQQIPPKKPAEEKPVGAQSTSQDIPSDRAQGAAGFQTPASQHTLTKKSEVPAVVQTQTVQQASNEKPVETQSTSPIIPSNHTPEAAEVKPPAVQHTLSDQAEVAAVSQTLPAQQTLIGKLEHSVDTPMQAPQITTIEKPEALTSAQTQAIQPVELEKHEALATAQTQPIQAKEPEKHEQPVSAPAQPDTQHASS